MGFGCWWLWTTFNMMIDDPRYGADNTYTQEASATSLATTAAAAAATAAPAAAATSPPLPLPY